MSWLWAALAAIAAAVGGWFGWRRHKAAELREQHALAKAHADQVRRDVDRDIAVAKGEAIAETGKDIDTTRAEVDREASDSTPADIVNQLKRGG